jgi:hypothetical protein
MAVIARHKPPDSKLERRICTAMIISSDYLRQIQQIYKPESLKAQFAKHVANWCIEYYEEFKQAPGKHIQDIFHQKTKINFSDDHADDISEFLIDISEEYESAETLNIEYLLQQTENHFRLNALDDARVRLQKSIISGKIEEGESIMKSFERTIRNQTQGIDVFRDKDAVMNALSSEGSREKMMRFPGTFGDVIGNLERGFLVAYIANTGIGKTWFLLQNAWWAAIAGFDVLYVSFEMSEKQVVTRTYQWITGKPKKDEDILIPRWDCLLNQNNTCQKRERSCKVGLVDNAGRYYSPKNYPQDYHPCTACKIVYNHDRKLYEPATCMQIENREKLTAEKGMSTRNAFEKLYKRAGCLDFVRWPPGQKSVNDLRTYLQNREDYDGKTYDMIITDYASKMKANQNYREMRHGIIDVFQDHKALAFEKNALVMTAHQGNTVRDDKDLQRGSWQEAVAGLNELDIGILINQRQKNKPGQISDKAAGIYRLAIAKMRDDDFDANTQIYILSCLSIGRPILDSWRR